MVFSHPMNSPYEDIQFNNETTQVKQYTVQARDHVRGCNQLIVNLIKMISL